VTDTKPELRSYIKQRPSFKEIGGGMLREWDLGMKESLTAANPKE